MPNNRKPKLAPGSRWDRDMVMQSIAPNHPDRIAVEPAERLLMVFIDDDPEDSGPNAISNTDDALAAVRAAKLDPIFDSAVALAEYMESLSPVDAANLRDREPYLCRLLDTNSAAVNGATDD